MVLLNRSSLPDGDGLRWARLFTRILDLLFTILTFPLWLPIVVLVSGVSFLAQGRPVIFSQERIGLQGATFQVYKFRTMINDADQFLDEQGMPTRERVTRIGKMLRMTSLDEIPQVINFIKGDMSIVGPRPILTEWLEKIPGGAAHPRFRVRPGLTGQAQVAGRNHVLWSERLTLDTSFVANYSVRSYLRILLATPLALLRPSVSQDRNASSVDDL